MSINKMDNTNNINRMTAPGQEKRRSEPSTDEQNRMKHALRNSRRESEEHSKRPSSGESILHGLYSASNPASLGGGQASAADVSSPDLAALSEIAEQVLVSSPESSQREVRIQIKSSLLPETDIRLSRQGGVLSVHLVTTNEQSAHFLTMHKDGLRQQLENRLGETVRVDVQGDSAASSDGRSRQQRDLYAEQRNNDE
jgi:type III secretion system needle length determinant